MMNGDVARMAARLEARRQAIVEYIDDHWEDQGHSPTGEEVAEAVGCSRPTAYIDLAFLVITGRLERFRHYRGWRVPDGDDERS